MPPDEEGGRLKHFPQKEVFATATRGKQPMTLLPREAACLARGKTSVAGVCTNQERPVPGETPAHHRHLLGPSPSPWTQPARQALWPTQEDLHRPALNGQKANICLRWNTGHPSPCPYFNIAPPPRAPKSHNPSQTSNKSSAKHKTPAQLFRRGWISSCKAAMGRYRHRQGQI
uniref:Uncharacterized protein n=1 Tax=Coccidioides posadasii RMSCC 3488 TaxID=454284 RepID=A0A0J6FDZ9_COCPO|nr:hypothetical protein CPAG_03849 [Coccidioides posadasii RMSCC 3488]